MTGMYFLFQCTHTNTHKLIHMYMDMDSQRSAYTLSMTAPCVSFRPPVMLILDLPTQRISCPFNGCRAGSTQHYSLFGIQLLINLRHVKTSEYLPRLNSNPPFSPSCHPSVSLCFLFSLSLLWYQQSAFHFCLFVLSLALSLQFVSLK